jgi:hypothetical protein
MPRRQKKKQRRGNGAHTNHTNNNNTNNNSTTNNKTTTNNTNNNNIVQNGISPIKDGNNSNHHTIQKANIAKDSKCETNNSEEEQCLDTTTPAALEPRRKRSDTKTLRFANNSASSINNGTISPRLHPKPIVTHARRQDSGGNITSNVEVRQCELERSVVEELCNQRLQQQSGDVHDSTHHLLDSLALSSLSAGHQQPHQQQQQQQSEGATSRDVLVSRDWLMKWKQWTMNSPAGSKRPGPVVSAGLLSRVSTRGRVRSRSRSHSLATMTAAVDININPNTR